MMRGERVTLFGNPPLWLMAEGGEKPTEKVKYKGIPGAQHTSRWLRPERPSARARVDLPTYSHHHNPSQELGSLTMWWSWPRYKFSPRAMEQGIRQAKIHKPQDKDEKEMR